MANISLVLKFAHLVAIRQTHPEMRVYLNLYVRTHHKDWKKTLSLMSIPDGT